jgi:predicted permease
MPLLKGYAWQNAVLGKGFEEMPIEVQPVLSEVGPDYFATLGIPIVVGRAFTPQDVAPARHAVINESFAKQYFPGQNPIGQHFGLVNDMQSVDADTEVIGVIPDRKYRDLREIPPPQAYFPYLEGVHFRFMNVYLRTQADPRQIENAIRERMQQFDPHVPIVGLETVNQQIAFSLRTERLVASLSAVFGGLATLLAIIGLYGITSYAMMRRTREIGIRMALGALPIDVIKMVMREVLILIAAGLVAGFSLALLLANLVRSQLFGLDARDPVTFVSSALVLAVAAGLAGFLPALRASSLDATTALRQE